MQLLVEYRARTDEELAALVANGDRDAWGLLYERHVDALFAYAARILRDADAAADVVQITYVKAWQALGRRDRSIGDVRGWLFTIARNAALDEMRKAGRIDLRDGTIAALQLPDPSRASDPAAVAMDAETAALVWEAAGGLSDDDQILLDLYLRRGLGPDELAVALAVTKGTIYTRLSRLRDALGDALAGTLLARYGRTDCSDLDALLARIPPDTAAPAIRRAVVRHARKCDRCEESRRRLVSPLALLAALPVALPDDVRDELRRRIDTSSARRPAPPASGIGFTMAAAAAAIVALIGLVALAIGVSGSSGGAPRDPDDVHSTSHVPGDVEDGDRVVMAWTAEPGATAYSVSWDHEPVGLPDDVADLSGDATSVRSPALAPGSWWFHLRTRGESGEWTSTVHVGPFVIAEERARSLPDPTDTTAAPPPATATSTSTTTTTPQQPTTATAPAAPPPTVLGVVVTAPAPVVTLPPTTIPTTATTRAPATTTTSRPPPTTTTTTTTAPPAPTTTSIDFSGVVVPPSDDDTQVPRTGSIAGSVSTLVRGEGEQSRLIPLAGALVMVDGARATSTTDESGRFVVPDIPAGDVVLRVVAKGYEPAVVGPLAVVGGTVTAVDVLLTPAEELLRYGTE